MRMKVSGINTRSGKVRNRLLCSFVFGGYYSLTTVVPSISVAVHSTSLAVFDELIGVLLTSLVIPSTFSCIVITPARTTDGFACFG